MTNRRQKAKSVVLVALLLLLFAPGVARSEEPWRADFEQTCSKTSEAMTLSLPELNALMERCGALQKVIEVQDASVKKVYLKRLQLCRNLFAYMIDYKKGQGASVK